MDRRRLRRLYKVAALVGVGIISVSVALIVGPEIGVQKEIAASETTNAPDLLINDIASARCCGATTNISPATTRKPRIFSIDFKLMIF